MQADLMYFIPETACRLIRCILYPRLHSNLKVTIDKGNHSSRKEFEFVI